MSLKYVPGKTSCFDAVNYMLKHVRQFVMNHKAHDSRLLFFLLFYVLLHFCAYIELDMFLY